MSTNAARVYLAGPMRGFPYFNLVRFGQVATKLRNRGDIVYNPSEEDVKQFGLDRIMRCEKGLPEELPELDIRTVFETDTRVICRWATKLYLMQGWFNSSGARAEHALAKAIGIDIEFEEPTDARWA